MSRDDDRYGIESEKTRLIDCASCNGTGQSDSWDSQRKSGVEGATGDTKVTCCVCHGIGKVRI